MSAIRLSSPHRQLAPARAQLRAVSLANSSTSSRSAIKQNTKLVTLLTVGALSIAFANLILHILTSGSVYELANIQRESRELNTTSQIIADEVDSLSSQQNLSNSAQKLGMIANANPVFLSIGEQKVYGKPTAALNTDGRVARNLIANSVMTVVSTGINTSVASTDAAPATVPASNVADQKSTSVQVISNGGVIPASPTH
jgi:Na+-transporting NADH:ubiquinone oxidoreductase subunit NqrC